MKATIAERQASAAARWDHAVASLGRGRASVDGSRWLLTSSRALLDRPHPPFSGGADVQPDEAATRLRVRELIDVGILPRVSSGLLMTGPCRVAHNCMACGAGIKIGEHEIEIISRSDAVVIYLHRACLEIWTQEATDGDGPPPG
jgi:hypothetical protein